MQSPALPRLTKLKPSGGFCAEIPILYATFLKPPVSTFTCSHPAYWKAMEPTPRSRVRRLPQRGHYDRETIDRILDEGFVCHVGFEHEGKPVVIPTAYVRAGDRLYVHGSSASRMLRTLASGAPVCVSVTLIDGLVLARAAFHHSLNYRSVVVFGTAVAVNEESEKLTALRMFTEHIVPGRWAQVRPPNQRELMATLVLAVEIAEASAKVRTGGPIDDEEDLALPVWAGVIPLRLERGEPVTSTPPD